MAHIEDEDDLYEATAENDTHLAASRGRLALLLDDVAAEVSDALNEAGLRIPIFFSIPSSGSSYLTLATPCDPTNQSWACVCEIVCRIVASKIGVATLRSSDLPCVAAGVQMGAADLLAE